MQQKNQLNIDDTCANKLKTLRDSGISVIPLNNKRPHFSIKWKQYQTAIPSEAIVNDWINQGFQSYGVICGYISQGIMVIDFDCPQLYDRFSIRFPNIAKTYTVETKRGFHLYLKTKFNVSSRQFEKCDIKGDGGYVVGEGSCIDEYIYKIKRNDPIRQISYLHYQEILQWLSPRLEVSESVPKNDNTQLDLIAYYLEQVPQKGRNNALYMAARLAYRKNIHMQHVITTLLDSYIHTKAQYQHKAETVEQRRKEALQTIKSAYKGTKQLSAQNLGLANSIREAILKKQGSTISARLLDAIRKLKYKTQWITGGQLWDLARIYRISKKSLMRILSGDLSKIGKERLFKRFDYDKLYNVSQGDKRKPKSNMGRPTQYIYKIPEDKYLCNILKVENSMSDNLNPDDLRSAGGYRRALHRELIRRLSPMIRVSWFAERLGVHRRTIFRYNMQLGVSVKPMVQRQRLTVKGLDDLVDNRDKWGNSFTPGAWLETQSGKRYPAIREIGSKFLAYGQAMMLCRQLPSQYTLPEEQGEQVSSIELPAHLKSRATCLTYSNIQQVIPPDWATNKFDLGGYLAVYNGYEWTFRPPLRVVAYSLVKQYEDGLVYFIRQLKS